MILLENILKKSLQDFLKTSWSDVFKTSWISFEDVLKMSWKCLEDVLKMSWRRFWKTSWRRVEDVWPRRLFGLHQDLLKTSWRRLLKTKMKDVFKTSLSRRMFAGKHFYLKPLAKSIVDLCQCLRCHTDNIYCYIKQAGIKDRKLGKEQLIILIISGNILEGSWDACKSIEVAVD